MFKFVLSLHYNFKVIMHKQIDFDFEKTHFNNNQIIICIQNLIYKKHYFTLGRLSVMSTQTNQTLTSVNMKDINDFNIPNLMDLAPLR